jgi:predicted nucleotidyltransferase
MLKNTQINRTVTKMIATALGLLNDRVVYVGGAVVSLYINDPSADDIRPTKDLDLTIEIASLGELEALREELIRCGFIQSADDSVICRFRYEDVWVDVMATEPIGWAPGNRWFKQGFGLAFHYSLDNLEIRLLPLSYFLAAKFDAFFDRGIKDIWASHDYEDIVYLFNHVSDVSEQVLHSKAEVKSYLKDCAAKIIESNQLKEAIVGNLFYEAQEERFQLVLSRLKTIANEL